MDNYTTAVYNNTSDTSAHFWGPATTWVLAISMGIFMVLSIFGNGLVILVLVKHKGMRTRTNMFLGNLAIADLLTGVLLMPFALTTVLKGKWIFGDQFCQVNGFMMPLFLVASIHTLMYMAVHKYLTISKPFSHKMTKKKIILMILAAWVWASNIGYITINGLNNVEYKIYTTQCGPHYPENVKQYVMAFIVMFTCYLIPLCVLVFCYSRMFKEIRAYSVRMIRHTNIEEARIFQQQRHITMTLFLVVVTFALCWTPYIIYSIYTSVLKDKEKVPKFMNPMCYWFGYMNSAVNPIIYAFRSEAFRDGYRSIFCGPKLRIKDALLTPDLHRVLWLNLYDFGFSANTQTSGVFERLRRMRDSVAAWRFGQDSHHSSRASLIQSAHGSLASLANHMMRQSRRTMSTCSLPENFKYLVKGNSVGTERKGNIPRWGDEGETKPRGKPLAGFFIKVNGKNDKQRKTAKHAPSVDNNINQSEHTVTLPMADNGDVATERTSHDLDNNDTGDQYIKTSYMADNRIESPNIELTLVDDVEHENNIEKIDTQKGKEGPSENSLSTERQNSDPGAKMKRNRPSLLTRIFSRKNKSTYNKRKSASLGNLASDIEMSQTTRERYYENQYIAGGFIKYSGKEFQTNGTKPLLRRLPSIEHLDGLSGMRERARTFGAMTSSVRRKRDNLKPPQGVSRIVRSFHGADRKHVQDIKTLRVPTAEKPLPKLHRSYSDPALTWARVKETYESKKYLAETFSLMKKSKCRNQSPSVVKPAGASPKHLSLMLPAEAAQGNVIDFNARDQSSGTWADKPSASNDICHSIESIDIKETDV